MAFDYRVQFSDPDGVGGSADAVLVYDLQQALNVWSQYVSGAGTLVVTLDVADVTQGRAGTSPSVVAPTGSTFEGRQVVEPSAETELSSGQHAEGAASDITITVDPSYLSQLDLSPGLSYDSVVAAGRLNPIVVFLHELEHGLAMTGYYDQSGNLNAGYATLFDTLIQQTGSGGAVFTGAHAEAAYGGPVPLTTNSTAGQNYYHFGDDQGDLYRTPATVQDPLSVDLMNGIVFFFNYQYPISPLDLGVLQDAGYEHVGSQAFYDISDALMIQNGGGALVSLHIVNDSLAYDTLGALGPEWRIEGSGLFRSGSPGDFLLRDADTGAIALASVVDGKAQYSLIGAIGSEWRMEGNAFFLDDGNTEFLMRDGDTGTLVVGAVVDSTARYSQIGAIGPEWAIVGAGNFLGDGAAGFMIYDADDGALVLGQDVAGAARYTLVAGLGAGWSFVGTGDYLGLDKAQILLEAASGALVVGALSGPAGMEQYTTIGAVGPDWHFLGSGNYDGSGRSDFLMHNTDTGALVVGAVEGGVAAYTQVGAVGSGWDFQQGNTANFV